jgi:AraC-like DNA-binding protein
MMKAANARRETSPGTALREFSGPPRSFVWSRGAVHLRSGAGPSAPPDLHAHFAIQLTIGMVHDVGLRVARNAGERFAAAWLIGSDQPHWGIGKGPVATVFWDPLSPEGRRVSAALGKTGVLAISPTHISQRQGDVGHHYSRFADAIREELNACWGRGWTGPDLQATAGRIAELLAPDAVAAEIDPRIQTVVDALVANSSENVSLGDLAAGVCLSESRLAHLFRQEVGLPMRQYRLTLRMQEAVGHIAEGRSLTEAAHMAGFADSAHFSRTCRRMFGSAPSGLPAFEAERKPELI